MNRCFAAVSFGLEAVAAGELKRLGFPHVAADVARVYFDADDEGLARANLWLRSADRVYREAAVFEARTFDALFEGVYALDWADMLPVDARFPVAADAVQSTLKSVPDIQSIVKKAIVEKMKKRRRLTVFPETGAAFPLHAFLYKDKCTIALDTSGQGLNRRGYRTSNAAAPLRETLAAGLVLLSRYDGEGAFADPMCGSGAIAVEAALVARNLAPGLNRGFAFEHWGDGLKKAFERERIRAREQARDVTPDIRASDIDEGVLRLCRIHAKKAGVQEHVRIFRADVSGFSPTGVPGVMVCNPPYGVRLGQREAARALYGRMGEAFLRSGLNLYILCADDEFERYFGKRADKKRKLYNGSLRCTLYQYFRHNR